MNPKFFSIPVSVGNVSLQVAKGHFATRNSHTNYFIDVTEQRSCLRTAEAVARQLAQQDVIRNAMVDTILCLDGTRVIGTCLAQELTQGGNRSINTGREIYLLRENLSRDGKFIFRDNARFMLEGKKVLILMCSLTTGTTALQGKQSVEYYGGEVVGVASIYAAIHELEGLPVISIFDTNNIKDYASHSPSDCPMCKAGQPIDAVVNTFGFSKI